MDEERRIIKPELQQYLEYHVFPHEYIEKHNEILDYMEEVFVPSVEEILLKVKNLYNFTIEKESCVIRTHYGPDEVFGKYFANDTFMEDYIYRFIGLWRIISEICKIVNEYVAEICKPIVGSKHDLYKPLISKIFHIGFYKNYIIMHSSIEGYRFYVNIRVKKKYRDSIRSIIEDTYEQYYKI